MKVIQFINVIARKRNRNIVVSTRNIRAIINLILNYNNNSLNFKRNLNKRRKKTIKLIILQIRQRESLENLHRIG